MQSTSQIQKFLKEWFLVIMAILFSMGIFFGFGLYHLTKFETMDEHFWKYDRVPRYFEGWQEGFETGRWKKTAVNDKPGITTVLLSGIGLLFIDDPREHRIRDAEISLNKALTVYDSTKTEQINFALRFPILLFNTLTLPLFFYLAYRASGLNKRVAVFFTFFLATSPILIGASQIINPDALLWTFSALAFLAYITFLRENRWLFLFLAALFFGFTLLSKYTGNFLLFLFILLFLLKLLFEYKQIAGSDVVKNISRFIFWHASAIAIIFIGGMLLYTLLLPASWEKVNYLWRGTVASPVLDGIFVYIVIFLLLLIAEAIVFKSYLTRKLLDVLYPKKHFLTLFFSIILLAIFLFTLISPQLTHPIIPLENVKEYNIVTSSLLSPKLDNPAFVNWIIMSGVQLQPFLFSLTPVVVVLILLAWMRTVMRASKISDETALFFAILPILYFGGLLYADVLSNARYSILLYPLFFFFVALSLDDILSIQWLQKQKKKFQNVLLGCFAIGIIASSLFSLWNIKPFYLNYGNFFLPKQYTVTDAWGYGSYEAAEYLNSLPDAENLLVWSDRTGVCQFIKGRCISGYKIETNITQPDYFVITHRGTIRRRFTLRNQEPDKIGRDWYYGNLKENYEWALFIDGREPNFIKVIKRVE